ncbi:NAD-dependent epimerase/dehydratase family protein [Candidatus Nitrosotenuis cloacae]|uniref:NAD-dependent epimerase/dehydratase family protein n=1 Tax=Candidatus Nitrosotenuis cloacae TaxID=1603555 RepID=UPI002281D48D|nr:GDP-mannose 4,6-dehydratase [Candidatus Nitrosotenuis cloacae]
MKFNDKRVLVTGGAGFIGSEVVSQLLDEDARVTVLDNFASGKKHYLPSHKKLTVITGDIMDERVVKKAVRDQEIIFNLAALPFIPDSYHYPVDFFKTNTIGNLNVLWEAIKSKSTDVFIQISTSEVYGSAQFTPMDENHPTAPYSTYAVSKLAADRATFTLHKENGIPVVVIRPFNTFGPRYTQPYIIPEIINQMLNGATELSLGNINATRDFTFVSDTANALLKAANEKKAIGEIINIGSGTEIRIQDLAHKIAKVAGKKIKIKTDESRLRPYDVNRLICNNTKAVKLLKWRPRVSIEAGLKITFDWAKKNKVAFNAPFKRWYYKNTDD